MANRKVILSTGEFYHLYNRGNSKQDIFKDDQDRKRFTKLLCLLNNKMVSRVDEADFSTPFAKGAMPLVAIGAYVLMDNHFHILIKQLEDGGVTLFMRRLGTAYAMYFNQKYKRSGGLFEGTFKSEYVDTDRYLRYLYAYIHLNPAKRIDPNWKSSVLTKRKDVVDGIKQYPYSSFYDYCGIQRQENKIIDPSHFPLYFEKPKDFTDNILSWLTLDSKV